MPKHPEVIYYSRFMAKLDRKLSEGRSPETVNLIMRTLRTLCGEKFKSLKALHSFPTLVGKESYVATGLKHCYVALRVLGDPLWQNYYERYKNAMDPINAQINTYEATEQQKKNWMSMDSLHSLLDRFEPLLPTLPFKEALGVAVLALFILIPARRSGDYWKLFVQREGPPMTTLNTYNPDSHIMTLVNYKTSDRYGSYAVHVPDRLANILNAVIDKHPTTTPQFFQLLCKDNGEPYTSCNCVQMLLNAIGAKTTPTAIRHSLISESFPTLPEQHQARQELATAMAHSVETQRTYIRRVPWVKF